VKQGGRGRRRWRIRRKRRGADDADVPVEFGCCLFEVVASAVVFFGLLLIPAAILLR
jgi:hypothetical protein